MSRQLLTNCPNCAGELNSDGTCPYCKTKVRYANELDIQAGSPWVDGYNPVEIAIKVKRGNETIVYPFEGYLSSMKVQHEAYMLPRVELTFNGTFIQPKED